MTLSEEQLHTLRAAMDRIIPKDDFPSASEVGADLYLLHQLEGDLSPQRALYQEGLDALNVQAQAAFSAPFAALDAAQQDLLLRRIELGALPLDASAALRPFFRMLVNHTAEGYYSDPGNGGNRERASWQMVGFEVHEREIQPS